MSPQIIIFDFDGTIADTHQYMVTITNDLADEFHFKKIPANEVQLLKDRSAREMVQRLKVPLWKIPQILTQGKKKFYQGMMNIQPFEGWQDVLQGIKNRGFRIGILSSNSIDNINKFLIRHKLNLFDFIHTTPRIWSKHTTLLKILTEQQAEKNDVLYVGDETRDIDAARKAGIKVAAVTWGYNSDKFLKKHHPDFLINQPHQLLELLLKNKAMRL